MLTESVCSFTRDVGINYSLERVEHYLFIHCTDDVQSIPLKACILLS